MSILLDCGTMAKFIICHPWKGSEGSGTGHWRRSAHSLPSLMVLLFVSTRPHQPTGHKPHRPRQGVQIGSGNLISHVLALFWQATREGCLVLFNRPVAGSGKEGFHQWEKTNKQINNGNNKKKHGCCYAKQQKWTKVLFSMRHLQTILIRLKPERMHFAKELALSRCFHIFQPCSLHG